VSCGACRHDPEPHERNGHGVTPEPHERSGPGVPVEAGHPPTPAHPASPASPASIASPASVAEAADLIDADLTRLSAHIADIRRDMAAGNLTPEQFGERIASIGGLARALGSGSGDAAPGCTIDELLRP
jgi:hypothetical protein